MFLTIFGSCRGSLVYRPMIYGHDYVGREIITPKTKVRISTGDREFNKFVSISFDDLNKLAALLKDGKFSKKVRILVGKHKKNLKAHEKSQALE